MCLNRVEVGLTALAVRDGERDWFCKRPSSIVKKQNRRYTHLLAKRVGTTKSGCPITLPKSQLDSEHELAFRFMVDGELVWKTFPRTPDGWRAALELARGDAQFMKDMSSIESAKACGFNGWLLQLLIEEGFIPRSSNEPNMVADTPSI